MKKFTMFDGVVYTLLIVITLISVFPLLHTVSVSFSESSKADAGLVSVFPVKPNVKAYQKIMEDQQFFQSFWVSIKRVFYTVALGFFVTLLMAYPLSRNPRVFKLRNPMMWLLIFVMLFSGGLIPFYMVIRELNLYNTMHALVLPGVVSVFNIILVVNFFRNLPKELEESASMDGAGPWRMLFSIYLPLSVPVMATITLFTMVGTWNEYLMGLILTRSSDLIPLQTYLQTIFVKIDPTKMNIDQLKELGSVSNKTLNAAKIVTSLIPIILIYPLLQRYFIHGIVLGAVKE